MAYEIVSTSSPNNLEGKTGFGTVIKTQRLPIAIDIAVSGLNGYTHLFGAGDPKNPICWSYLQIRADNKTWYVLSRIADSGADHTLRSNRLASHLVLQARELTACSAGPASIMLGGEIIDQYNGTAHETPERTLKPYTAQSAKKCKQWEKLTGDAGWGGVLAESVMTNKPAYIIYNPGTDILPLFAEAIDLIPASFRWKATFSTYYSSQIERYYCLWRGIAMGSPIANAIPQGDYTVIDLTKPLPAITSNSNLVSLARNGSGINSPVQPISASSSVQAPQIASSSIAGRVNNETYDTSLTSPMPSISNSDSIPAPPLTSKSSVKRKSSSTGLWAVIFIMFLALIAAGGGLYYAIDSINQLKQENEKWKTQTENNKMNSNEKLDSYNDTLRTSINDINAQIQNINESVQKLNESVLTFVKKINKDFDCSKKCFFEAESDAKNKIPIHWNHSNANHPTFSIKIDNNEIGKLTYSKSDKTFTLTLNQFEDFKFVLNHVFVSQDNNIRFNFLNEFVNYDEAIRNSADKLSKLNNEVNNLQGKIQEIDKKQAEPPATNNPQPPVNQTNPEIPKLQEEINNLKTEIEKINTDITSLKQNNLTSVIRFEKGFDTKKMVCLFSNKKDIKKNKQIKPDDWANDSIGEHKADVTIDNIKIGTLIYNDDKKSFSFTLNGENSEVARAILENYTFRFASSEPVYFF